jgi:hypothetical protein
MKRFVFVSILLAIIAQGAFAQTNFKWDIVIDSLEGSKQELYLKTKQFIAETWKSSKDVIQNDDSISGVVLVRAKSAQTLFYDLNNHDWVFTYDVKFMIKDGKCRIIIDDVYCISARVGAYNWPLPPVQDEYPTEKPWRKTNLSKKNYLKLMAQLKTELNQIALEYNLMLVTEPKPLQDW